MYFARAYAAIELIVRVSRVAPIVTITLFDRYVMKSNDPSASP
ncbi:MAG: hypothetical protein ACRDTM_02730 [Micromonosporaceae bacterium]